METGIYSDIPNETYHAEVGLSKSGLVNFDKSASYYQWRLKTPMASTPAMKLGTHVHTRILEPARHRDEYIVAPDINKRTNAGKAEWAEFEATNAGKTVVKQDEMDIVNAMAEAVGRSETATALLAGGIAESSIWWNDHHGNLCKCRPDYLAPKHNACVELKTTNDISDHALTGNINKFRYGWQNYHYMKGLEAVCPGEYEAYVFIFIESKPPYPVITRMLSEDWLIGAELEIEPLLKSYAECMKLDLWPGDPDEVGVIPAPAWYVNQTLFD